MTIKENHRNTTHAYKDTLSLQNTWSLWHIILRNAWPLHNITTQHMVTSADKTTYDLINTRSQHNKTTTAKYNYTTHGHYDTERFYDTWLG